MTWLILWIVLILGASAVGVLGVWAWYKCPPHFFDMGDHPRSERW